MPFNTATPNNAINPMPAEILNGMPLLNRAIIPPMAANGIAVNISPACDADLKAAKSSRKMSNKEIGTATCKRCLAAIKFSN